MIYILIESYGDYESTSEQAILASESFEKLAEVKAQREEEMEKIAEAKIKYQAEVKKYEKEHPRPVRPRHGILGPTKLSMLQKEKYEEQANTWVRALVQHNQELSARMSEELGLRERFEHCLEYDYSIEEVEMI